MGKDVEVQEQGAEFSAKDYQDPSLAPLFDSAEIKKWSLYRAMIAEFIATLLFLYITVLTIIGYKRQSDTSIKGNTECDGVGILGIAWAFGGMIFVLVYCTADISGGHINPAAVSEDELKNYFSKHGSVVEQEIIHDHTTKRSCGFGFVVFDNDKVVDTLLVNWNMIDMDGTQVESKKAETKKSSSSVSFPPFGSDSRSCSYNDGCGGPGAGAGYGGSSSSLFPFEILKTSSADRYIKKRSSIVVIGLSVHTAPVEMRERLHKGGCCQ